MNANVHADRDFPLPGVHRDEQGRAYLEFAIDDVDVVQRLVREGGFDGLVTLSFPIGPLGPACLNCGNVAGPTLPAKCPNCGFEDISSCPVCGRRHSRSEYEKVAGGEFLCPTAVDGVRHRVGLAFNDPMFNLDGSYRQPLVVVLEATSR